MNRKNISTNGSEIDKSVEERFEELERKISNLTISITALSKIDFDELIRSIKLFTELTEKHLRGGF